MTRDTAQKRYVLLPCPFCGTPARWCYVDGRDMSPADVWAECSQCDIGFCGGAEKDWEPKRGWFDRLENAHQGAAEKWNRRAGETS